MTMKNHKSTDESVWNRGGWPLNSDWNSTNYDVNSIHDIYCLLSSSGHPVYAYYGCSYVNELGETQTSAHLVLIVGVACSKDIVYTNNPWGIRGEQSFADFLAGFAHRGELTHEYQLGFIFAAR